jgi:phosphatidate cytidylyltransferase
MLTPRTTVIVVVLFLLSASLAVFRRGAQDRPMAAVAVTTMGAIYGGGCLSFGVLLRHLPEAGWGVAAGTVRLGAILLAFPFAVTWVGDSAAFFAGRRFGRRKLLPAVSPGKTVVGSVASLVASALVGGAMGGWLLALHPRPGASVLMGVGMGLVLALGAQVGDLAESVLKREAGVKDSGTLLPGHGGVLDRFDALLFNLPLSYFMFRLAEWLQ